MRDSFQNQTVVTYHNVSGQKSLTPVAGGERTKDVSFPIKSVLLTMCEHHPERPRRARQSGGQASDIKVSFVTVVPGSCMAPGISISFFNMTAREIQIVIIPIRCPTAPIDLSGPSDECPIVRERPEHRIMVAKAASDESNGQCVGMEYLAIRIIYMNLGFRPPGSIARYHRVCFNHLFFTNTLNRYFFVALVTCLAAWPARIKRTNLSPDHRFTLYFAALSCHISAGLMSYSDVENRKHTPLNPFIRPVARHTAAGMWVASFYKRTEPIASRNAVLCGKAAQMATRQDVKHACESGQLQLAQFLGPAASEIGRVMSRLL
jgi:hypothetical protein